jgi:hypothetical protein
LIHENGSSHKAGMTADYFAGCHGWCPRLTAAPSSWLDQAEWLIHAFSDRYLKRGSCGGRKEFVEHVIDSRLDYHELYAHPI